MPILKNITLLILTVFFSLMATSAYAAGTPAQTLLQATATLKYAGNEVTGITASVDVKVQLIPAIVSIVEAQPANTLSLAQGSPYEATYIIQSNANGPDTYTVSFATLVASGDLAGYSDPPTASVGVSSGAISLGATSASVAGTSLIITVPADGIADDSVNGIEANDTLIINGAKYTVETVGNGGVVDNVSGTSTIKLTAANGIPTVAAGTNIFEYKSFTVNIANVGSSPTSASQTLTTTVNVTGVATPLPSPTSAYSNTVVITVVPLIFEKYVRNFTTSQTGTGTPVSYSSADAGGGTGGTMFYPAQVQAVPGDILEYYLRITTPAAGITNAKIVDQLAAFTTYVVNTTKVEFTGTTSTALAAVADVADPFFPLTGPSGYPLNTITPTTTVHILYRVSVD